MWKKVRIWQIKKEVVKCQRILKELMIVSASIAITFLMAERLAMETWTEAL